MICGNRCDRYLFTVWAGEFSGLPGLQSRHVSLDSFRRVETGDRPDCFCCVVATGQVEVVEVGFVAEQDGIRGSDDIGGHGRALELDEAAVGGARRVEGRIRHQA